jgi:hypothetical protein
VTRDSTPLEPRLMIIEFVVGENAVEVHLQNGPCQTPHRDPLKFRCATVRETRGTAQQRLSFQNSPSRLAMVVTNRQFKREVTKVWYSSVRFHFHSLPCMKLFLQDIGSENQRILFWLLGAKRRKYRGASFIVSTLRT